MGADTMLLPEFGGRLGLPSQKLGGLIECTGLSSWHFDKHTKEKKEMLVLMLQYKLNMLTLL